MTVTVKTVYTAIYEYDSVVIVNDNELKVFPRREPWQEPISKTVETDPPGRIIFYNDRYGNPVARVTIKTRHNRVIFKAESTAKLTKPYRLEPMGDRSLPLKMDGADPKVTLFLRPSPLVDPAKLHSTAQKIIGDTRSLNDAITNLTEWVYEKIEYQRGYTTPRTPAHKVVEIGKGVCQDKAHLLIGLLRSLGIPARYVSGALTTEPGETHAWVEAYWPGTGWTPIDPTHNRVFDLKYYYIKFAHGRDYSDVPPINGYYISRTKGRIKQVRVVPEILEGTIN